MPSLDYFILLLLDNLLHFRRHFHNSALLTGYFELLAESLWRFHLFHKERHCSTGKVAGEASKINIASVFLIGNGIKINYSARD